MFRPAAAAAEAEAGRRRRGGGGGAAEAAATVVRHLNEALQVTHLDLQQRKVAQDLGIVLLDLERLFVRLDRLRGW